MCYYTKYKYQLDTNQNILAFKILIEKKPFDWHTAYIF